MAEVAAPVVAAEVIVESETVVEAPVAQAVVEAPVAEAETPQA
ncbi:unannotated protein [freshwater metagenome]|uniref:Unannotated protein n=1 Tax=freshwater metagenome TaxID=449393 RepID=A0A6J7SDP5_9ZZZZ